MLYYWCSYSENISADFRHMMWLMWKYISSFQTHDVATGEVCQQLSDMRCSYRGSVSSAFRHMMWLMWKYISSFQTHDVATGKYISSFQTHDVDTGEVYQELSDT